MDTMTQSMPSCTTTGQREALWIWKPDWMLHDLPESAASMLYPELANVKQTLQDCRVCLTRLVPHFKHCKTWPRSQCKLPGVRCWGTCSTLPKACSMLCMLSKPLLARGIPAVARRASGISWSMATAARASGSSMLSSFPMPKDPGCPGPRKGDSPPN